METISDSWLETLGRHSLREMQAKRQKCREDRWEREGWGGMGRAESRKDRWQKETVSDRLAHWYTDTHTNRWKINEQIFWQRYVTPREMEREHQGKRHYSSSQRPTKDGLGFSAVWCNSPETVSVLHIKHSPSPVIKIKQGDVRKLYRMSHTLWW